MRSENKDDELVNDLKDDSDDQEVADDYQMMQAASPSARKGSDGK